jgi:tetratricopeptide (TPR) repeat protein
MTELDERIFPALTSRPAFETWQVAAIRLPGWLPRAGGEPFRPWVALCMSLESGKVVPTEPGPEDEIPSLLVDAVTQAGRKWRSRPARVQIAEGAGAGALKGLLAPFGVAVEVRPDLPEMSRTVETLRRRVGLEDPRPGPLTGAGVTPERLAAFARAAAGFLEASGWRHLSHEDRVRIEAPEVVADLRCFVLDHNGGRTAPELHFFAESKGLPLDFEAGGDPWEDEAEVWEDDPEEEWEVSFLKPWAAPSEDGDLWEEHGLPWAGGGFIPVARCWQEGYFRRPDRRQLALFEGLLAALAATREEDLDAGRWEKRVDTAEGPIRLVLTLPDLLEPPEEERPMGLDIVWRVMERSMRGMRKLLAGGESPLEMDEDGRLSFSGPIESLPAELETPEGRAEALLDRAYAARGRRAVLLARQALEVWPDCADAYNLLGERAPDSESAGRLFELGMAAGERALGPAAFAETAGHFWGVLETRPYMRAREGLAQSLVERKRYAEAAEHLQEMLRLNPEDNQGVRHSLVNVLIALDRDAEAWELLDRYAEDHLALLEYPRALLRFRAEGDSLEARRALKRAVQANRLVPGILLHTRAITRGFSHFAPGREEEAAFYVILALGTWAGTEGALDWLRKRTTLPARPKKKSKTKKGRKRR